MSNTLSQKQNDENLNKLSNTLSSFTANLTSRTKKLRSLIANKPTNDNLSQSHKKSYFTQATTTLTEIQHTIEGVEVDLLGNPDSLSMSEVAKLCTALSNANTDKFQTLTMTLRQYGYKGAAAPSPKHTVPSHTAATPTTQAPEESLEVPEESLEESPEAFRTPLKPWEEVAKRATAADDSPATPKTPTLETVGLTDITKSNLKQKEPEFHHQVEHPSLSAKKTPSKPMLRERIDNLRKTLGTPSANKVQRAPPSARASLPVPQSNTKFDVSRSSISFATSTTFTPNHRRSFKATPNSRGERMSLPNTPTQLTRASLPSTPLLVAPAAPASVSPPATPSSPLAHSTPPAATISPTIPLSAVSESDSLATPQMPDRIARDMGEEVEVEGEAEVEVNTPEQVRRERDGQAERAAANAL